MVKLQWYVPILANRCPQLCLRDTFPKRFPGQLSPKKYGKQENSQHLLIGIHVFARHWQVSTLCEMLLSQPCLMQRDALQSVSKFKHTSIHSQSKHSQADKQLGKCPESHRTRHSSRQAKIFDVTASPASAALKGLLIVCIVCDSYPSACVFYFEVACLDKIRARHSVTFLFSVQVNSNGTLLALKFKKNITKAKFIKNMWAVQKKQQYEH